MEIEELYETCVNEETEEVVQTNAYPRKCVCCNEGIIQEPYDICEVCGWEDDKVQNDDPDYEGGANKLSLKAAREKYLNTLK